MLDSVHRWVNQAVLKGGRTQSVPTKGWQQLNKGCSWLDNTAHMDRKQCCSQHTSATLLQKCLILKHWANNWGGGVSNYQLLTSSLRSCPAQNTGPLPRITIARSCGSAALAMSAPCSESNIARDSAFLEGEKSARMLVTGRGVSVMRVQSSRSDNECTITLSRSGPATISLWLWLPLFGIVQSDESHAAFVFYTC